MQPALAIVHVAAGVLLPITAHRDEIGRFGSGSRPARARQRLLTRGRMFVMSPVFLVIGVVVLRDHFSG